MIEPHDLDTYRYTVVFLPDELAATLPFAADPRLRISGEIADHPMTAAWQPCRGHWYLMLSKPLLKAVGLTIGMTAEVRFRLEAQDDVEMPASLLQTLGENGAAQAHFDTLTPGKQRALAHRVLSAKTEATQTRRVGEVVRWLAECETDLRRLGKP